MTSAGMHHDCALGDVLHIVFDGHRVGIGAIGVGGRVTGLRRMATSDR